ncbi:MAG: HD domain-containing protein [Candidatus Colwellbacteria bacterium]|nr:HD domain-containing protein [Candidatus Colwellbacteria bacterium]
MTKRTKKIIDFLYEIEKFKLVERRTYLSNQKRHESDAEHEWHMAMMIWLFSTVIKKKFDVFHAMKLALVHDLPEIYAGDTYRFDPKGNNTKRAREVKAARKLFAQLPKDLDKEFWALWDEYEENKTYEARIVHFVDGTNPGIQNMVSKAKAWKENKLDRKSVFKRRDELLQYIDSKELKDWLNSLVDEAVKKKYLI